MTSSSPEPSRPHSRRSPTARSAVLAVLRDVPPSPDPVQAFSNLAAACVPVFSEHCAVELLVEGGLPFRCAHPSDPTSVIPRGNLVRTSFDSPDLPSFAGVVEYGWADRKPGPQDAVIAELLVEQVVTTIREQRSADRLTDLREHVANLERALQTNRMIGIAMGIVMATHRTSERDTFELLVRVSQNSHRKLHDVAADVVLTGTLEWPSNLS